MGWPNYDDGDAGSTVPTVAYTPDPIAPTCLVWGASGGAYTLTTLTNGFPVQPGTSTTWAISASSLPLPSGAATAALQTTGNTSLATLAGAVSGTEVQVDVVASLPAGTNAIGKLAANDGVDIGDVTINNASIAVTGTFWQATQPVSIASAVPVTDNSGSLTVDAPVGTPVFVRLSDGTSAISTLPVSLASVPSHDVTNAGTFAVQVTSAPTTTVTGTVAATQSGTWNITNISGTVSLPTGAATAANQSTANTSLASIDTKTPALGQALAAASVPVVLTAAQLTTLTPPAAITGFATESTLSTLNGKVTACNTGAVVLAAGAAAFGKLSANDGVDIGDVTINNASLAVTGTFWQATQPVSIASAVPVTDNSGSLTVDAPVGTPVFVRLSDGASAISTLPVSLASVPSHAVTNAGTFAVQVDGAALTSLQLIDDVVFAEDAAHATGDKGVQVLSVRRDTAASTAGTDGDYASLTTDSTGRLWCNVSNTVTVSGTVTANAGTNLNTSLLALETGGNLAAAATSLSVMDDWDESDRAKVNPIVGQAGVQGGSGTVSATTQRVVLATDVALPTGTNTIGSIATVGDITIAASNGAVTGAGTSAPGIVLMGYDGANQQFMPAQLGDNDGILQVGIAGNVSLGIGTLGPQKSEDVASADGDAGIPAMAVRKATPANTSGADGDYEFLQMSAGRLWTSTTIDAALPAGTNAIGKLAANSGVTIGAVEIAASQTLATVTTVSTVTTCSTVTSLSQFAGNAIATNTGDVSAGTLRVREAGAPSLTCGQVSVATTATEICAARAGRRAVIITQHGTTAVYLGSSGSVTTSNGLLLTGTAGAIQVIPGSSAVHGIVASGTQTVSYAEVY